MIVTTHQWGGAVVDVYQFAKGEKLPRHKHPWVHTTAVVRGETKVTLFDMYGTEMDENFTMTPSDQDYAFEPGKEHEIEALVNDTIIINMRTAGPPGQAGADGGITFDVS